MLRMWLDLIFGILISDGFIGNVLKIAEGISRIVDRFNPKSPLTDHAHPVRFRALPQVLKVAHGDDLQANVAQVISRTRVASARGSPHRQPVYHIRQDFRWKADARELPGRAVEMHAYATCVRTLPKPQRKLDRLHQCDLSGENEDV